MQVHGLQLALFPSSIDTPRRRRIPLKLLALAVMLLTFASRAEAQAYCAYYVEAPTLQSQGCCTAGAQFRITTKLTQYADPNQNNSLGIRAFNVTTGYDERVVNFGNSSYGGTFVNTVCLSASTFRPGDLVRFDACQYHYTMGLVAVCIPGFATVAIPGTPPTISISSQPSSQTVCDGSPVSFDVSASGGGSILSYQWFRNSVAIPGANSAVLNLSAASSASAGDYHVRVSSPCDVEMSASAVLTVNDPPSLIGQPLPVTVCAGGGASFSVSATASGVLTYQWQRNSVDIPGATTSSLSFTQALPSDAGDYRAIVTSNGCASESSSATLTVLESPSVVVQPPSSLTPCPADNVQVPIVAQGGQLSYQWRRNAAPIAGATGPTLIGVASTLGAGTFDCEISNPCGATLSSATTITLANPPTIQVQPQSVSVCEGRPLTLCVSAVGDAPLVYVWRRNGQVIASATSACYSTAAATMGDAGVYRVEVANTCGAAASLELTVTVVPLVQAAWSALSTQTNGDVNAICVVNEPAGRALYAAGAFTQIGGGSANRVARFDGAVWQALGTGVNDVVWALAAHDDGSGPALYAGGRFTSAGGVSASRVARWNGSSWSALGGGLPNGGNPQVFALSSFDDGSGPALWVGGSFNGGVLRWRSGAWSSAGGGLNNDVYTFAVHTDSNGTSLHAGGDFGGGFNSPRGVARWNGAGWLAVGNFTTSYPPVRALASVGVAGNAVLFAGGSFSAGGVAYVVQLTGSGWQGVGEGLNGPVAALIAFDEGDGMGLYAGGDFTTANGEIVNRIARWKSDDWSPLGVGASARVHALATTGQGLGEQLLAAGTFTSIGGVAAASVAAWTRPSVDCPGVYCSAGTTSGGCTPTIVGSGAPSATATAGFTLSVSSLESQRQGLIFYGVSGSQISPWGPGSSSFLCVKTPTQRMSVQNSGGVGGACDGVFLEDFNTFRAANPSALGQPFASGQRVDCQAWFRDPAAPKTTNLSNAMEFTLAP
jgi:hypothetical protein